MARLLGPDMGSRLAILPSGVLAATKPATVYADEAGTVVADIAAYQPATPGIPGAAIGTSMVTTDPQGLLPLFWFPDGVDRLWVSVNGGALVPIDADNNGRFDGYQRSNPPPMPPLTAPLEVVDFTSTPVTSDADMRQVYVTHSDGIRRLVSWDNERGYPRMEQVPGALFDALSTAITAHNGTGRAYLVQQRGADNVRRDVGGFDKDGRPVTSDQAWTDITTIDPAVTGRYTEDASVGVAPLQVRYDTNDVLRLQGRIAVNATGTSTGHVVFILPAGFAPSTNRLLGVVTSTGIACPCEVLTNGDVVLRRSQAGALSLSFDDLTIRR